jgi:tRNA pseudouridine38-40 synthase
MESEEEGSVVLPRYFLHMAYDGTNYHGWQRQPNAHSVQEEIETALRKLLKQEKIVTVGCGRTDTGVHAQQFYLHFDSPIVIEDQQDILRKLNLMLPWDLAIFDLFQAGNRDHARYNAISRSYIYHIHQHRDPFHHRFSTFFHPEVNINAMNEAAAMLLGTKDFACFCKSGGGQKTTICTVSEAFWVASPNKLAFHISADRFLRNMVRAVVGTLLLVGQEKIPVQEVQNIINAGVRSHAGESVPPQGLHLVKVEYPANHIAQQRLVQ